MSTEYGELNFLVVPRLNELWARLGVIMCTQSPDRTQNIVELGLSTMVWLKACKTADSDNLEEYGSYVSAHSLLQNVRKLLKGTEFMSAVNSLRTNPLRVVPEYLSLRLKIVVENNGPGRKVLRQLLKGAFPDLEHYVRKIKSNPLTPVRGYRSPLIPVAPRKQLSMEPRVTETQQTVHQLQTRFLNRLNGDY